MPIGVALIRGINVGSTRSLPMELLRECCARVGMQDAKTYIQSGNVVFRWSGRGLPAAAAKLEDEIEKHRGFRPSVVLRTAVELAEVVEANPFQELAAKEPSKLLSMFLQKSPFADAAEALKTVKTTNEKLSLVGSELFIFFPEGAGKSKISFPAIEKAVGVGTARNWNTTLKLLAMVKEFEA